MCVSWTKHIMLMFICAIEIIIIVYEPSIGEVFQGNTTSQGRHGVQGNNTNPTNNNGTTHMNYSKTSNSDAKMHVDYSIEQLFDSKRMELRSDFEDDCFCPNGRKNWIHFTGCSYAAGLKDRQNVIRQTMWYADQICAKIALECTPTRWLSKTHGCHAPPKARWDAYFTFIRKRKSSNGTILSARARDILHWDVNESMYEGLEEVKNTSIVGYEMGRKLHSEGTPFVWQFNRNFWETGLECPNKDVCTHTPRQIIRYRRHSATCGPVEPYASEELLNVAQLVSQGLNIRHSNDFVTLHLRRGDDMNCDTEIKIVIEYLKCSIGGDNIQKVLVLTNGEALYLQNLQKAFSEAFPQWEMISIDQFVESKSFLEKLDKSNLLSSHDGDEFLNDNCFRFGAERVLVPMARYHLERGRQHCKQCDRGGSFYLNNLI